MPILHALVLGIVQGLTEFLPISSSGHLVLIPEIFGWRDPDTQVDRTFDVAVHIGTLIAVVGYFRTDLGRYAEAGLRSLRARSISDIDARIAWLLVIATIPAVVAGAAFNRVIDEHATGPLVVGTMLIVFGVLLAVADRLPVRRKLESARVGEGWPLGIAQAVSLVPGTSRAGITMTAGRALGFDRDAAARVSFLMAVPVTFAAGAFIAVDVVRHGIPPNMAAPFAVGVVTSAITAYIVIWWLLRFVRTHTFTPFVIYRVVLGVGLLVWFGLR